MNNSAIRVLEILELFAESSEPLTVSDIVHRLGYPKTSVFDIVNILASRGFIKKDNERAKTYVLGHVAYQVGMAYLTKNDLYSVAHPILTALRDKLGETCYLAVREGENIIYLDKVESLQPIRSTCNIGAKNLMYLTGLGKAMLAAMPEDTVHEICLHGMTARTPSTITTPEALFNELAIIRQRGCAYDMGEDNPYVRCVASPIRGRDGELAAAISISMLDATFTDDMKIKATENVISAACEISRGLGWKGGALYGK